MINHSQQLIDTYPLINCTNCGTPNETTQQQGNFIDDGLDIDINTLGYYGGFTDDFPPKEGNTTAHLCHDCCVILFNALPGFAAFAGVAGGHGNLNSHEIDYVDGTTIKPCCPYAFTLDKTNPGNIVAYVATPDLSWKKLPDEYQ